MHLTSSRDPTHRGENVPVAIFCFSGQRKFIRVSEDYEDTTRRIRRAFKIANGEGVLFQTSTFEACKGMDTVIDESAYPLMWSTLEEVHVVIDDVAMAVGQVLEPVIRHDDAALPTPTGSPSNEPKQKGQGFVDRPSLTEESDGYDPDVANERDDDERNNQGIANLVEEQEDINEPPEPKQTRSTFEEKAAGGSKVFNKFKPAPSPNVASASNSEEPAPSVKKEKTAQAGPSRLQDTHNVRARPEEVSETPAADDPRFEIVITSPDNSIAHFKTRGKHPVRKVLAAACKTFGIPYDRAHLVLVLAFEEDGQTQTHHFVCPPEDTMSKCGVEADSKLFIKIDHDGENGDSD